MEYGLKYLKPVNDLHLDFDVSKGLMPWAPPGKEVDHLTALVIAGDIWHARKFLNYANQSWLAKRAQRYRYVVFVLGNHDYWGGALNNEPDKVRKEIEAQGLKNVIFLERDEVIVEGVKFVGGTLWTDMNKQDPMTRHLGPTVMGPDFNKIKKERFYAGADSKATGEYARVHADDFLKVHLDTRAFIFQKAKKTEGIRKLVVVTHMAPCFKSIDPYFVDDYIANGYYVTELGNRIAKTDIDFWFHGHMHFPVDYMIGNTRIINNPRGYKGMYEVDDFRDDFLIEL
jgi:Icc-related predicted phosphoesterase